MANFNVKVGVGLIYPPRYYTHIMLGLNIWMNFPLLSMMTEYGLIHNKEKINEFLENHECSTKQDVCEVLLHTLEFLF